MRGHFAVEVDGKNRQFHMSDTRAAQTINLSEILQPGGCREMRFILYDPEAVDGINIRRA